MAVEVCHDAWTRVACLYDNTTDTAFGPIFTGPGAGTEAEDFLEWIKENGQTIARTWKTRLYGDGSDPRDYSPSGLRLIIGEWWRQYEPVIPEPQSLRVDDVEGHRVET